MPFPSGLSSHPTAPQRGFWRIGAQTRVLLLVAVALAIIWSFVIFDTVQQRRRVIEHNRAEQRALAHTLAEHTRATLHRIDAVLYALRQQWRQDRAGFTAAVAANQAHLGDVSLQVSVIGRDGMLAYTNLGEVKGQVDLGDREHFRVHADPGQDRLFVSSPVKGRVSGKWSVQLSRRLDMNQRFEGVIVASIDPAYFARFHAQANLGQGAFVTISRDTGEVISRSMDLESVLGRRLPGAPWLAPGTPPAGSFEGTSPVDGVRRYAAWYRVPEFGLTVVVGENAAAVEARAASGRDARIALALAASLALAGIAFALSRGERSRLLADSALQRSEDRFERFFRASPVPHVLTRAADQRYVAVNGAFAELFGVGEHDVLGRTSLELGFWADPVARGHFFKTVGADGRFDNSESTYRTAGGRLFPARQTGVLVDVRGEAHLLSTIVDISDEVALREANARMAAIVGSAMDAIITCDDTMTIRVFNQAAAQMFGVTAEEAIGTGLDRFLPARFRAGHGAHMRLFGAERVTNRNMGRAGDVAALRADGTEFPVEASISHVEADGKHLYTVIMRDVTERQVALQRVTESEARFRSLAEQVPVMIWVAGADGAYLYLNRALLEFSGREVYDAGRPWWDDIHPEDRVRTRAVFDDAFATHQPYSIEYRRRRHDGEYRWVQGVAGPRFDPASGFAGYVGTIVDITEAKRAEQTMRDAAAELEQRVLERTRELTETINELEGMTATISHDLRAPLARISGFASLLATEEVVKADPHALDFAQRIARAAARMKELIEHLIGNAALGRVKIDPVPVDLDALVGAYVAEIRPMLREREIEWRIHPLPRVWCDAVMARQVVQNLIENAVKYTGRRERAVIEIGPVEAGAGRGFFVKDNGAGFDPAQAGHLFGVFRRLHSASEFAGSGIGLANVHRIMQRHRGRIWYEAESGRGATFFVAFPQAEGPLLSAPPAAA